MKRRVAFDAAPEGARVSGLFHRPADAWAVYVLAHGAGAGMEHPFLEAVADGLFDAGVATLRYQFPYMEAGRKRPDAPPLAQATVRSAVAEAAEYAPDLPLLAGGKSFGGRMTSSAAAAEPLTGVRGIVFLGFPLHAPGRVGQKRSAHLENVDVPMLFLQGTRDSLADLERMRAVCRRLGRRASLHVVEGGDHSFKVLKRSGRTAEEVTAELCATIVDWARRVLARGG
jgi:predicted alpha/beta-hydrolase family hydrolase